MNIEQCQRLLGDLYREDYKDDKIIRLNLIELGWSIKRLLDNERITMFDDYEDVKRMIFDEMRLSNYK